MNNITQPTPPKITFPCDDYPIKIIGHHTETLYPTVLKIVHAFFPKITPSSVKQRYSRDQRYLAITVTLSIESEQQLKDCFEQLKEIPDVIMVL